MMFPRAALGALLLSVMLAAAGGARAQYPEPRAPEPRADEQPEPIGSAYRLFEAARWPEAVEAFEAAARERAEPLPAEALLRWGIAAAEAGRPLAAYVRLSQFLARRPGGAEGEAATERVRRAREALLSEAARFSRLSAVIERQPDDGARGERSVVRVAARGGEVSLEGMSGFRVDSPEWRRAEEIPTPPYLELLRRLLDMPAALDELPHQAPEAGGAEPRRAVVLRLVVGEEDCRLEAFRGTPYRRLKDAADLVVEFAHKVRSLSDADARPAAVRPAPARPGKKRR
jgi:hypothetical protein